MALQIGADTIDAEYGNILAALQTFRERGDFETGLQVAKSMGGIGSAADLTTMVVNG